MKKAITLLILTASCIFGAWELGYVEPLFLEDKTYITWLIVCLWLLGICLTMNNNIKWAEHISDSLVTLGLLGTLLGIKIAIGGSESGEYTVRDLGVSSAINTTIIGVMGNLYINTFMRLIHREKRN